MSKRLQVLLDEADLKEIRRLAQARKVTVADWVRQALLEARRREPSRDSGRKLDAVRAAVRQAFPTASIDEMLADIERGYGRNAS